MRDQYKLTKSEIFRWYNKGIEVTREIHVPVYQTTPQTTATVPA